MSFAVGDTSSSLSTASPLADSFQRCSRSFKALYLALFSYGAISLLNFNDEYGRFGVWGGEAGADRTGRGSLDDVLRNDRKTASIIAEVLENLEDDLKTCTTLAKAASQQGPARDQFPDGQEWLSDEDSSASSESDSADSNDGGTVGRSKARSPTQRILHLLAIIVDHIQSLLQISSLLRRPTISNKYLRSLSKRANQESESTFLPWDLAHVAEKKRRWVNEQKGDCPTYENLDIPLNTTDFVCKRLAAANVRRREQLVFWQSHPAERSAINLPTEQPAQPKAVSIQALKPTGPIPKEVTPISETSRPTRGTKNSFSTVAKSDLNDAATFSGRPRTEYVTSTKGGNYVLRVPDVPKTLEGSSAFKCPYCCTMLDARSMQQRETWKKHVFRDLRPYVCTFESCENPEKLYLTRHDWIYHETQMHRRQWICASCSNESFPSRDQIEEHLCWKHPGTFHESQLETMINICEQPLDDSTDADCPLCPVTIPLVRLRFHLGTHLEDLALFVLPINVEDRSHDVGSDKAEGAPGRRGASETADNEDGLPLLDYDTGSNNSDHFQTPEVFSALLESKTESRSRHLDEWFSEDHQNIALVDTIAPQPVETSSARFLGHDINTISRPGQEMGKTSASLEVLLQQTNSLVAPFLQLLEEIEKCRRLQGMLKELAIIITEKQERKKQKGLDAILDSLEYMPIIQHHLQMGSMADPEAIKKAALEVGFAYPILSCCSFVMKDIIKVTKESIQPLTSEPPLLASIWKPELDMESLAQTYEKFMTRLEDLIDCLGSHINDAEYLEWRGSLLPIANLKETISMLGVREGEMEAATTEP